MVPPRPYSRRSEAHSAPSGHILLYPRWRIDKGDGEVVEIHGNVLAVGGASAAWEILIGHDMNPYSSGNAHLEVGNGQEVPQALQTANSGSLLARAGMAPGYPRHTASNTPPTAKVIFRATFGAGVASFFWNELALFNAATGGRMFSRQVREIGEKDPGSSWTVDLIYDFQPEPNSV